MRKILFLLVCLSVCLSLFSQSIDPAGPLSICEGESVTLAVKGATGNPTYTWERSTDGGATWEVLNGQVSVSYKVSSAGRYRAKVAANGGEPKPTESVVVSVNEKPVVDFTFNNNSTCAGTSVKFDATVSKGKAPFTYTWNFGDNTSSTTQDPTHQFSSLGGGTVTFSVSLTVTDDNGCSSTVKKDVSVKQLPQLQFNDLQNSFNEFSNCVNAPSASNPNFTVQLGNNSPSKDIISSYNLNWGDGTALNGLTSTSFPRSHTYSQLGTFNLVVTAVGANGCSNTWTQTVVNQSNPAVGISAPGSTSGCAPSGFWFKLSRYEVNSPGTTYTWDFGDGSPTVTWTTPVTVDSIFHEFTKTSCTQPDQQFIVKVTATNGCKSTTATVDNITIYEKPKAGFNVPASACVNQSVNFTNSSIGGYNPGSCNRQTKYIWDFGDPGSAQNTSTADNPSHTYTSPGTYTVTLIAEGSCGKDTVKKQICIVGAPVSSFSVSADAGCAPFTVNTTNSANTLSMCSAGTYTWSVAFSSSGCAPNTSNWEFGAGSNANSVSPSFIFRTPGIYTLTLAVNNSCGTVTSTKTITVKSPPSVSIAPITNACGTVTINPTAAVTNCGTGALSYKWTFSGGTPSTSNDAIPGAVTFSSPGTHSIKLEVTNECGTSTATRVFTINAAPNLSVPANQTYCAGQSAGPFTFTSNTPGATISWATDTRSVGLSTSTGGNSIPAFTTTNSSTLSPIKATITVIATANGCSSSSTFTITVNPKPLAPTTSPVSYCQNATATPLTATAADGNQLIWYNTSTGGTGSTTAPTPSTTTTGPTTYYVSQKDPNTGCEGPRASLTVTVAATPSISSSGSTNPANCGSSTGSITLRGLAAFTTYLVSYTKNGTVIAKSIASDVSGVLTITGLTAGTYDNIFVSLGNCTSNKVGPYALTDPNPPATPTATSNSPICSGQILELKAATTSSGSVTYSWTGPNGFTNPLQNPTIPNATAAASGTYTVVTTLNGCTSSATVAVTVNPKPAKPVVTTPVAYCLNGAASPLIGTAAEGNTLTWYKVNTLTNGSATTPTPSTTTAGQFLYYVTQKNPEGCESDPAVITVNVSPLISGNSIADNQTICAGATPQTLTGQTPSGGTGSYAYQWQVYNENNAAWENIPGAVSASYTPGPLNANTRYRRIVNSTPCMNDISNEVAITVQPGLSNTGIEKDQIICAGTKPELITGQTPTGGSGIYTYEWEYSTNGTTWNSTGSHEKDFQPEELNETTWYRRKVSGGSCAVTSNIIKITVNPVPEINTITDKIYCPNTSVQSISFTGKPATGVVYSWTNDNTAIGLAASGTGNLPAFTATNTSDQKVPLVAKITVTPTYLSNGVSCVGEVMTFTITVLPPITIQPIPDEVVCTGTSIPERTLSHDAGTYSGYTVSYKWTVSGSGISLTSSQGDKIPGFATTNSGSADLVATITVTPVYSFSGQFCDGPAETYTVTVKPKTPNASAGPDQILCAQSTYTMQATAASGTTGTWTILQGAGAAIADKTSPTTAISGLQPGQTYIFQWEVSGFASCPATTDNVEIKILEELTNTISPASTTVCAGQSVTINGSNPLGGTGSYTYQWESSTNGVTWTAINGQTDASLTFIPAADMEVRRWVYSRPCEKASESVFIKVQAPVSNNIIAADHSICPGSAASLLVGSQPGGANGNFQYQWESSTNGSNWSPISGAAGKDYDPGMIDVTTSYRRVVQTDLCTGPQSSTSNIVTVTVNPDAKAEFIPTKDIDCAPFILDAAVIGFKPYPDRNGAYDWFANGTLIGTGATFPGYTIQNPGESVVIKLKALSLYSCKNDSMEFTFRTQVEPEPAFTQNITEGCGPLAMQFTNTTPNQGQFAYRWDFGNGQTSTEAQPRVVTFQPNPTYGDTTYQITLSAVSGCGIIQTTSTVLVKSKPKALFAPSSSVGCSPMTVTFNNTSLGWADSYTWDFGDGEGVITTTPESVTHTYHSGVRDTFYAKLVVTNECGSDEMTYAIVVTPNTIKLDFALNGNEETGCAPHTVRFINNTRGATSFAWDFGDGNVLSTTKNIDTVAHTFALPGTYTVRLLATNGCSDTSTTETITVYPKPKSAFTADRYSLCIGETVNFTNASQDATSYEWDFGDGTTSNLVSPTHSYQTPGIFNVVLRSYRVNAPGSVCSDMLSIPVEVVAGRQGTMTTSETEGTCAPFTVNFTNPHTPAVSAVWDFGDGTTGSGDVVSHTYTRAGTYTVTLTAIVPGGCTYTATQTIRVLGPSGSLTYTGGMLCNNQSARFEATVSNTDKLIWDFGDGTVLETTERVVYHTYPNPGAYLPILTLASGTGCRIPIKGTDSIRVDNIKGGFTATQQPYCGFTTVTFTDTTHAYYGKASVKWNLGDGTTATGDKVTHTYTATGTYSLQLIFIGNSGCSDTITKEVEVFVPNIPDATIEAESEGCTNTPVSFKGNIQSQDAISTLQWSLSNGVTSSENPFLVSLPAGQYTARLVVGTVNGCFDTAFHNIKVDPSPTITASNDVDLCRGNSAQLSVQGADSYSWTPLEGLSCTTCPAPLAAPLITTPYIVLGTNSFGCSDYDTVVVTVIQPFEMTVSADDSICIGSSANLLASGASGYSWTPATGLSSTTASNPVATPDITTRYRVVGYDGYNCFTDTAFVLVAVGEYPIIDLGPDLSLATGTMHQLKSVVQNGPISRWVWTPSTNLNCPTCPMPVAEIKKDISYSVEVTNAYGCSAKDMVNIMVFCESAQVFIPNAFTPDGDGTNDVLMVRGSGIVTVKSFRIFNRWGELIFERTSFPPNNPAYGWDGRIRGVIGGPDVFVYTAEVLCENGTPYTYKGNVSILK